MGNTFLRWFFCRATSVSNFVFWTLRSSGLGGVKCIIHMTVMRCREIIDVDVSENSGTPKSSILIGCSIVNHPFWGYPYFWKYPCKHFLLPLAKKKQIPGPLVSDKPGFANQPGQHGHFSKGG